MGLAEVFVTGIVLSMDAFAVAVCKGLGMRKINYSHTLLIALFFGGFQALMPLIGWYLGDTFEKYINAVDHWIAFVLLAFIGGKMAIEAITEKEENKQKKENKPFSVPELTVLALATSIDALAVGIVFALTPTETNIWSAIAVIGCTTFVLSVIGVAVGNKFGSKYQSRAELVGGVVLIVLGIKILLEGLSVI